MRNAVNRRKFRAETRWPTYSAYSCSKNGHGRAEATPFFGFAWPGRHAYDRLLHSLVRHVVPFGGVAAQACEVAGDLLRPFASAR
jgi:hypothetical protein